MILSRLVLVSLFLLYFHCANSQQTFELSTKPGGLFDSTHHYRSTCPKTGSCTTYYKSGGIFAIENYEEGFLNGEAVYYYRSSQIKNKIVYKRGEKTQYRSFYKNGQLKEVGLFTFDGFNREYKIESFYDSTGNNLIQEGKGQYILYYENGNIERKGQIENYFPTGEWSYFNSSGVLIERGNFKDFLKDGLWKGWYSDGSIFYEEKFEKGVLKNGISFINGKKISYSHLSEFFVFSYVNSNNFNKITESVRYPKKRKEISNTLLTVKFIIETDSTVKEVQIIDPVHPFIDSQVIDLIKATKWAPETYRGYPRRSGIKLYRYFKNLKIY